MTAINQLNVGDKAKILGFAKGNSPYRQRLLAMGLTPGAVFELLRIAPLGDPVQILIRGMVLSLRKSEASILQLSKVTT